MVAKDKRGSSTSEAEQQQMSARGRNARLALVRDDGEDLKLQLRTELVSD